MISPHHLHATAAAWSLQAARQQLTQIAADEAAQIAAEQLEAPALLHSPAWGRRHALGGHSDPTPGMLATGDRPTRLNRWEEMADRATRKLNWLAVQLDAPGAGLGINPLTRILDMLVLIQPGTARVVAQHLADEDTWIRNALWLAPQREPLPGVECPACAHRQLYVQTAGPTAAWTVVCLAAECHLCTGQGCRCGMPGAVEGVAHIWPRTAVLASTRQ